MKQNNWEKIEKEFDKEFCVMLERAGRENGESSEECQVKIEQFLHKTILDILDKAIGEEKKRQFPLAKELKDRVYDCEVVAYNQKRSEIIKLKERLK